MKNFVLRVVDRGKPKGVPSVNVYLMVCDPPIEYAAMSSDSLSPDTAELLVESFAALGVKVEREKRDLTDVWKKVEPKKPAKPAKKKEAA